jgi:hypothetical protein
MKKGKRERPLHLDMGFDEALKRVAQTDPRDLPSQKSTKKTKRKRGQQSTTAEPRPPASC